jgi:hypothetical protein
VVSELRPIIWKNLLLNIIYPKAGIKTFFNRRFVEEREFPVPEEN